MIWCNLLVTSGEVRNVRAPTIRKETELLKLPPYWEIVHIDNEEIVMIRNVLITWLYIEVSLILVTFEPLKWMFTDNQELYDQFSYSFENITVADLITVLNNYGIRIGIIIPAAAISSTEYSVSKSVQTATKKNEKKSKFENKKK